jgi:hypothetical protein
MPADASAATICALLRTVVPSTLMTQLPTGTPAASAAFPGTWPVTRPLLFIIIPKPVTVQKSHQIAIS